MLKWALLAAGIFLFFNGMMARTYHFPNQQAPEYCWQMDTIRLHGCFYGPAGPQIVVWGSILIGAALIVGCLLYSRRRKA